MFPSNYFLWPFCGILATLFSQTLLQPAQGNFDEIYTEMHEKLLHFQKLAQRIIENDDMDFHFFTEHELPRSEMTIRDYTSKNKNDEISKIMEKWRSEGIVDGAFFKRLAKICRRDYIEVDPEVILNLLLNQKLRSRSSPIKKILPQMLDICIINII
jgi:hypothetical protein